jgi:Cu/Ag efflux protein CusF
MPSTVPDKESSLMQFASAVLFSLLAGLSSPALACNDHAPRTEPAPKPVARAASLSAGEVRGVDLEEGTITLAHGKIASLRMAPMTSMMFKASDTKLLTGLKPGDRVNFCATMVGQQPTITQIRLAKK